MLLPGHEPRTFYINRQRHRDHPMTQWFPTYHLLWHSETLYLPTQHTIQPTEGCDMALTAEASVRFQGSPYRFMLDSGIGAGSSPNTPVPKSALFWDFTQRRMLVSCRRFETPYRSHLQGSNSTRTQQNNTNSTMMKSLNSVNHLILV